MFVREQAVDPDPPVHGDLGEQVAVASVTPAPGSSATSTLPHSEYVGQWRIDLTVMMDGGISPGTAKSPTG
jgi:hypothetical protein